MYYYVYTLSFNGIPFYAGVTHEPLNRYKDHYQTSDSSAYNYVRHNLINIGRFATMDFVLCTDDRYKAYWSEGRTILALNSAGFYLLNKGYNYSYNDLQFPKYAHIKRLPHKWCSNYIQSDISNKQAKIRADYERQAKY